MKNRPCDSWPKSFQQHLKTMPGDIMEDEEPYIFIELDDLETERQVFQNALPVSWSNGNPVPSKDYLSELASNLPSYAHYARPPSSSSMLNTLSILQPIESMALHYRLEQTRRVINHIRTTYGRDYDPTSVVAVNHRWDQRWSSILFGSLSPAYIALLLFDDF